MLIERSDLSGWNRKLPSLAVLGFPVKHSLSPAMHNAALAAMPGFGDWRYFALEVPAGEMSEVLPQLHAAGFLGLNLTIPHKVDVLPLLEEVDAEARQMGAVNTLIRTPAGYRGANTDGFGIREAVRKRLDFEWRDAEVWLLGAGGAARAIAVECLRGGVSRLTISNRSSERLEQMLKQLLDSGLPPDRIRRADFNQAPDDWSMPPLVINATALGLKADDPAPLDAGCLPAGSRIYDTTYGCSNQLAADASRLGIAYADGLSMLVWQGVRSLGIWTGAEVPDEIMSMAAVRTLDERRQL